MSPKSINRVLDQLGEDFDKPLKDWKENITCHLEKYCLKVGEEEIQRLEKKKDELSQLAAAGNNVGEQTTSVDESLSTLKVVLENRNSGQRIILICNQDGT